MLAVLVLPTSAIPPPPSSSPSDENYMLSLDGFACASSEMRAADKHAEIILTRGDCLEAVKWFNVRILPSLTGHNGKLLSTYAGSQLDHDLAFQIAGGVIWPGCYYTSNWLTHNNNDDNHEEDGSRCYFQDYNIGDRLPTTLSGFTNICRASRRPSPPPPTLPPHV